MIKTLAKVLFALIKTFGEKEGNKIFNELMQYIK